MKTPLKRLLTLALAAAMVIASLTGCSGSAGQTETTAATTAATETTAAATEEPNNLVIGTTTANDTFNISGQSGAFGRMNYNDLANADFVYRDADGTMKPYFLTSYTVSEDGKELDMTFPTDKVWHDGEPVTAEDVIFTLEYRRDVLKATALANLVSVEKISDGEVKAVFSEAEAFAFLSTSCGNNICVLPEHIWKDITEPSDYTGDDAYIGCGPYKLVSYDVDAGVSQYEAVPEDSYLGTLTVDTITVRSYSSHDSLMMAMANGEIDCMFDYANPVDYSLLTLVDGVDDIDLGESEYAGNYMVYFGMEHAPANDYAFREAVTECLNWTLATQAINGEYGEIPGSGLISPSCRGFDSSLYIFEQDVEKAKATLADAGYADVNGDGYLENPDGSELKVKVTPQFSSKKQELLNRLADIIMASLDEIGVQTYIDEESLQSSEIWEANAIDGNYDIMIGYCTSGMAKYNSAFRYYAAVDRFGNDDSSTWLWGTNHDEEFNRLIWEMNYADSDDVYLNDIEQLQQMASETLFGFSLCWEKCFFPYSTANWEGFDNWPSWGVINAETFYTITAK